MSQSSEQPRDPGLVIEQIASDRVRKDASDLCDWLASVTSEEPVVWSRNTIGFGRYHYRYASGEEGDFFKIGFAPRSDGLTLYVMSGLRGFDDILDRLGKHQASKSTVKFRRLADLSTSALEDLINECVRHLDHTERELGSIPRMSEIPPRDPGPG